MTVEQNDLKEVISASSSHLWFSDSKYYEQTSQLTNVFFRKDGHSNFAYQNVNNYKLCVLWKCKEIDYKLKLPKDFFFSIRVKRQFT